jgi:hypothetical protein
MGATCNCACRLDEAGEVAGLCAAHQEYLREVTNRTKEETRKEATQDVTRTYEEALEAIGSLNPMKRRMIKLYVKDQLDA